MKAKERTFDSRLGWLRTALAAIVSVGFLSGCVSYYDRYYGDSGVYYGGGYQTGYVRPAPPPLNPVVYPYWSLDYFYFSRYHHPYSVFVGYHEPLYYPYPGWAFGGYYRSHRYGYRPGFRVGFGFGYPWYGFGHVVPRFSLGFFSGFGHYGYYGHYRHRPAHRLRDIDRRLRELQEPASAPSRAALVSRDTRRGMPIVNRRDTRSSAGQPARASILRGSARSGSASTSIRSSRPESRNAAQQEQRRVVPPRSTRDRPAERGRLIQYRDLGNRSASGLRESAAGSADRERVDASAPDLRRQRQPQSHQRNGTPSAREAAAPAHRGGQSRRASAPPVRLTPALRARVRNAPPARVESAPRRAVPPQRHNPDRGLRSRSESVSRPTIRTQQRTPSRISGAPDRNRRPDRSRLRDRPD